MNRVVMQVWIGTAFAFGLALRPAMAQHEGHDQGHDSHDHGRHDDDH